MKSQFRKQLLFVLCIISLGAQADDYWPLVRGGRVWVNRFHHTNLENGFEDDFIYYLEFKGDTVIGGKTYAKCFMTSDNGEEVKNDGMVDYFHSSAITPCSYLREDGPKVWSIDNFTISQYGELASYFETLLYDFQELLGGSDSFVDIDDVPCRQVQRESGIYVESIGFVANQDNSGDLIGPEQDISGDMVYDCCRLSYVLDKKGNIIYKSPFYEWNACDINSDGKVDISDVNEVINVMLGKSTASADINGDGKVDISDVNAVINAMLGKEQ